MIGGGLFRIRSSFVAGFSIGLILDLKPLAGPADTATDFKLVTEPVTDPKVAAAATPESPEF